MNMRTLRGNSGQTNGQLSSKENNSRKKKPVDDDDDVGADGDETTDDEGGVDTPPPTKEEDEEDAKADEKSEAEESPKAETTESKISKTEEEVKEEEEENEGEFEVDQIVDMETKLRWKCPVKFRVRWVGYGEKDDTWLSASELSCDELITDFLEISGRKSEYEKMMEAKKRPTDEHADGFRQSSRKTSKISYSELDDDAEEILPSGTKSRNVKTKAERKELPMISFKRKGSKRKNIQAAKVVAEKKKKRSLPNEDHEVEAIAGMREINGYPEYKVRWKGWAPKYDTWLKEDELNCPEILKNFKTVLEKLEQQEDWQVEEILDTRKRKGKPEYLVHWKGFESKCDSWEPEENLEGCKDVLEKYLKQGEKQKNKLLKEGRRTRDNDERPRPERFVENYTGGSRARSKRNRNSVRYTEEQEE